MADYWIIQAVITVLIPIFTSQLEKSRDATDEANVRSAIAEVTAAVLADDKANSGDVKYSNGTYTVTVKATGKTAGWSGATTNSTAIKIGGATVDPSIYGWTITGSSENSNINVTAATQALN